MNDDNILLEDGTLPNNESNIDTTVQQDEINNTENIDSESSYIDSDETAENVEKEITEESSDGEQVEDEITLENNSTEQILFPKVPYHERYYLKYGEGKRTFPMALDETSSFLKNLGFDGGELKQAREGKDCAENFANPENSSSNKMYCSYCGNEISGIEFYRMPDGRIRCTTCSNSIVKSKVEIENICQRIIDNMENFFGATIDVPVSIEVLDERKLKKKIGVPLGTRDEQSMLILGVAINKKKKYKILLENGAPRISLIATFAHELTHIWQYTHWDSQKNFKKCPKNKQLLIYEGMAKWAEIQYLYLVGETTVARREEFITRNRQDEYGIGFCLYEERFPLSREAMFCEETPFTPNNYPID